jgi:transposase
MSREIIPDRTQTFLLPPALDDWIPREHPARFIAAFVDALDLPALGFLVRATTKGRPAYSAKLLLSVFCYCYFSRIRSFRAMEQACLENIAVLWLTGSESPDHNTLWRFWNDHRDQIHGLLKQSVRVAAEAGLVGMVVHAVDGTKIRAQASMRTGNYRAQLKAALTRVDASIREMEAGLEASSDPEVGSYRLPAELADATALKAQIERSLEELDQAGTNSLHPSEPDARVMKCDGRNLFGYNAQAVADEKAGIIVAADVVAKEVDHGMLVPMIERTIETTGSAAETTLADKGYSSGEDLAQAQDAGHDVLVSLTRTVAPREDEAPFHASRFLYDEDRDCCVCPLGSVLRFQRVKKTKRQGTARVYHCSGYKDCPRRWECSSNKRGRTVELSRGTRAVDQQRAKQQDPTARQTLRLRCRIVEPVFAFAKVRLDFRRWSYRNLESNRAQWALVSTVANLCKIYRVWRLGGPVFA